MLHMEIIHQIPDCHTHTQPWICEESTPRCMRAITVALPTNKQNHNWTNPWTSEICCSYV